MHCCRHEKGELYLESITIVMGVDYEADNYGTDTGSSFPTGIHSHSVGVTYSPKEQPF